MGSSSPHNLETHLRLVTLMALAVAFAEPADAGGDTDTEAVAPAALPSFAEFGAEDRQQLQRLATAYAAALPEEQARWLTQTIGKVQTESRKEADRLDEHIHPSHIIEVLREEPLYMQSFVVGHLPRVCAEPVAVALGVPLANLNANTGRLSAGDPALSGKAPGREGQLRRRQTEQDTAIAVVRRRFLSRFVTLHALDTVTYLDMLSGRALAQLVRLLGARETAVACRSVEAVETISLFLRRFATEDACAIATHMATLTDVTPQRLGFAERAVQTAMSGDMEGAAMLDHIGLSLLAIALAHRDPAAVRYTLQKLPLEVVRQLEGWLRRGEDLCEPEIAPAIINDIETLAARLHAAPPVRSAEEAAEPEAGLPELEQNGYER